jgi:hypothetical protein
MITSGSKQADEQLVVVVVFVVDIHLDEFRCNSKEQMTILKRVGGSSLWPIDGFQ